MSGSCTDVLRHMQSQYTCNSGTMRVSHACDPAPTPCVLTCYQLNACTFVYQVLDTCSLSGLPSNLRSWDPHVCRAQTRDTFPTRVANWYVHRSSRCVCVCLFVCHCASQKQTGVYRSVSTIKPRMHPSSATRVLYTTTQVCPRFGTYLTRI